MSGLTKAKRDQLKSKFQQMDKDGNNVLSLDELSDLLKKGNPGLPDSEVQALYTACDKNGDGVIDFDEFLDYIYDKDKSDHRADRAAGGRHARLAGGSVGDDGSEGDWGKCRAVFQQYAGKEANADMDNKEWAKLCKDNKLVGGGFSKADVDLIFTKVVPRGKRRLDFPMFQDALRHIAQKKGIQNIEIMETVGASSGPILAGTKLDAVRFYDDKSTFTGAAAHNTNFEGTDTTHGGDRHAAQQGATAAADAAAAGTESDWGPVQAIFEAFAGPGGELDSREFMKLVNECGLLGGGLTKEDVDVVFAAVNHGKKKFGFDGFKEAIKKCATKKKQPTSQLQEKIATSSGPNMTGATKTDAVRFYDDKDTYTGAAGSVFGREGHDDGRHERLHGDQALIENGAPDEPAWDSALEAFKAYGGDNGIDGRELLKLMHDCAMFDKKFKETDLDIVFAQAVTKGTRKLDANAFKKACRMIAFKKDCAVAIVQNAVANQSDGPKLHGTEAEYSRFHDDKDTYTGSHVGK